MKAFALKTVWRSAACAVAVSIAVAPASAIDLVVNSTLDQIDDDVTDGICHTAAGTCTLRAAVMTANRASGTVAYIIHLSAGSFALTRPPIGTNGEDGGDLNFSTPVSGTPSVFVFGAGPDATDISIGNADRVVRVESGASVELRHLTIQNGVAPSASDGGGCARNAGSLVLRDVMLVNCTAPAGGAVWSAGPGSYLEMTESSVLFGIAAGAAGGIWIDGAGVIRDSTIAYGTAAYGTGIFADLLADLVVEDSRIVGNFASNAGGGVLAEGIVRMRRSTVDGNQASSGGGLYVPGFGVVEIRESTIRDNSATTSGGGLFVLGGLDLIQSAVFGNVSAGAGGGLFVTGQADVRWIDSTVSSNSANGNGGGVLLDGGSATLNVFSSTIAFNRADADIDDGGDAGGIWNFSDEVNIRNSLVVGNYVQTQQNPDDCAGTVGSYGRNLFGDVAGCNVLTGSGTWGLLNDIGYLGPLQSNGGRSPTHALFPGSNAIDGGDPASGCIAPGGVIAFDQRGAPRISGVRCDVGAFEYGPMVFTDGFESSGLGAWLP